MEVALIQRSISIKVALGGATCPHVEGPTGDHPPSPAYTCIDRCSHSLLLSWVIFSSHSTLSPYYACFIHAADFWFLGPVCTPVRSRATNTTQTLVAQVQLFNFRQLLPGCHTETSPVRGIGPGVDTDQEPSFGV